MFLATFKFFATPGVTETQLLNRGKRSRSQAVNGVIRPHPPVPRTHHFPLGAEVGVALQRPVQRVLGDVGKHLVVQLVHCAVGYPAAARRSRGGDGLTTSQLLAQPFPGRMNENRWERTCL